MSSTNERTAADVRAYTTSTTVAPTTLKPRPPPKKGRKVRYDRRPWALGTLKKWMASRPRLAAPPVTACVDVVLPVPLPFAGLKSSAIVDGNAAREARPVSRHALQFSVAPSLG